MDPHNAKEQAYVRLERICKHLKCTPPDKSSFLNSSLLNKLSEEPSQSIVESHRSSGPRSIVDTPDADQDKMMKMMNAENEKTKQQDEEVAVDVNVEVRQNPINGTWQITPFADRVSFDQGFFLIITSLEMLRARMGPDDTIIVGIVGPTGSGKTTLANKITDIMEALLVPLTDFVRMGAAVEGNYDDPVLVDFELAREVLLTLREQKMFSAESYVPSNKSRSLDGVAAVEQKKKYVVPSSGIVVLEGMYCMDMSLRPLQNITVAIQGGIHLDLAKRITRDSMSGRVTQNKILDDISNVVFPMYKAFIEPDLKHAMIRIKNRYNPVAVMQNPTYVVKCKFKIIQDSLDKLKPLLPHLSGSQTKKVEHIYLFPKSYDTESDDRSSWIRVRRMGGCFYASFYNEQMDASCNVRPNLSFEISVMSFSGLLSLGYQIGAIMHRTTTIWYEDGDVIVSKEDMDELEQSFIQIKGTNRRKVMELAQKMGIQDNHIPLTFLQLYFRKMQKAPASTPISPSVIDM